VLPGIDQPLPHAAGHQLLDLSGWDADLAFAWNAFVRVDVGD
jgi:hypothetical protein